MQSRGDSGSPFFFWYFSFGSCDIHRKTKRIPVKKREKTNKKQEAVTWVSIYNGDVTDGSRPLGLQAVFSLFIETYGPWATKYARP